jgi:hypothetical protein
METHHAVILAPAVTVVRPVAEAIGAVICEVPVEETIRATRHEKRIAS